MSRRRRYVIAIMNIERNRLSRVSPRQLRTLLIAGIVAVNFGVLALAGLSLHQSKRQHESRAQALTQNLALAIDQSVSNSVEKIDLVLRTVADELERQIAAGGIDERATDAFLARHMQRLPELEAIRVADAAGTVVLGKGVSKQQRASWADRDYFMTLRDHADAGLQISKPRVGRVAKTYIVGFARRYNRPDGGFAGVISAPIAVDHFTRLLSRFDAGPKGTVVVRDNDIGLIARYPPLAGPVGTVGNDQVSRELRELMQSGVPGATYHTDVSADRFERIATFRRMANAPMMVLVATASEDYLADWHTEVRKTAALVGAFTLLSLLSAGFLLHLLNRLVNESARNQLYLQRASDGIHILDAAGNVVEASDSFAAMLGYGQNEIKNMNVAQWDAQWDAEFLRTDILPGVLAQERPATFKTRHRRKDGAVIEVEVNAGNFEIAGTKYIYASSRDIGERQRTEAAKERLMASFKRLNEIATIEHLPLADRLHRALAIGARHFGLEFGIVSRVEGDTYRIVAQVAPPDTLHDGQEFPFGATYCSITLERNDVVAIADMGHSAYLGHPCYQAFKLEAYIGAPLRVAESMFGTVNFSSRRPYGRGFDAGDLEFIGLLARWIGSTIGRDQTEQRVAEGKLRLKAIVETEPECVKLVAPDGTLLQ
ncbi:MAG: PAS domain S-box protein, partial [Rhodocyclaceae bacterium]|nr:PAS domain S-box protein [Rhodocyclaceae bacterium]